MAYGAPSAGSMLKSVGLHVLALLVLLLLPAEALRHTTPPKAEVDVVFYRPPRIEVPAPAVPPSMREGTAVRPGPGAAGPGRPAPEARPSAPGAPGNPGPLAPGESSPVVEESPQEKAGKAGILAFRDKFASMAQGRVAPRLGADARVNAAADAGQPSSRSMLATNTPGSSGGINVATLSRSVGGGGGGGGGAGGGEGGGGGIPGVPVGRATSTIASIGGGDRPLANGPGPARTDEEIQIVFDRYKASFYRLYNRELRNNPALKGQMVLRLTIEPDGSVSMCVLQSTDMTAPDLADQVVSRVRTINFGAKEGVRALTIVYPIDFLPAA